MEIQSSAFEKIRKALLQGGCFFKMAGTLSLFLVLLIPLTIFAQDKTGSASGFPVSGKITDEQGTPLPGVTILIKGTETGIMSGSEGQFTINANGPNDVLIFSSIGYQTVSIALNNRRVINVALKMSSSQLSDVVVVGYGSRKREDLTNAVASVSGKAISERPTTTNIAQGLAGKVPGVNVMVNSGRPGGDPVITIRGIGSMNSSNSPLYVVDGIVGVDPNTIDPDIIASVDILKDAAAASIYGSRGSNGVVVITTKGGMKNSSDISFNNTVSFGSLQKELPLLDAAGGLEMFKRQYEYVPGRIAPHLDPNNNFKRKGELFNADGTPKYNTDWQKAATRTAISRKHSLTFSGGKEDLTVLANISYRKSEGIMLNSNLKQIDGFLKITWDVKPWLNIQSSLIAGGSQANSPDLAGYPFGQNAIRRMYSTSSFLPVKYEDGTYSREGDYPGAEDAENPVRLLNDIKNVLGKTYTLGNIVGTFHLTPHIDLTTTFSGQTSSAYTLYYAGTGLRGISETQNGIAQRTNVNSGAWTNEDYITYKNTFGKHTVNVVGGASWYFNTSTNTFAGSQNFFDNTFTFNSLQAGSVKENPTSDLNANQFNSYFARVHYGYDDRYLLDASYRIDGSSRFGVNNQYGKFPSVSAGWNIAKEQFFEGLSNKVNNLKIRASYGFTGNAEIGNYVTMAKLVNGQTVFNHNQVSDVVLGSLENNNLTWEKSRQFNIGLDAEFLNSRIGFTANYYDKVTKDLLYSKALPATTGFAGALDNIGSIQNRGIELSLNTVNINAKEFSWRTELNFSLNRSKIISLNGDILYTLGLRMKEGGPLNEFFGYVRAGIWGTKEAQEAAKYGRKPGDIKFVDTNNNGKIDFDDQVNLGSAMPRYEANMTNTFTYKRLSLYVDLQSMVGLHLANYAKSFLASSTVNVQGYQSVLEGWTPENQNTMVPALRLNSDPSDGRQGIGDSYYVEDATFLRVRNIALTYRLNPDWFKNASIKNLSIGLNVENAFLFTKYQGYDPEYASFGGYINQGVDFFQYPKPRTISISLNANF